MLLLSIVVVVNHVVNARSCKKVVNKTSNIEKVANKPGQRPTVFIVPQKETESKSVTEVMKPVSKGCATFWE